MSVPRESRTPRTVMWTYPWDLSDGGIDRPLAAIKETAGVDTVSLAVAYHISTYFLPNNSARHVYFGEDGRVYFVPQDSLYTGSRLRPRVSEVVSGPTFLPQIVEALRRHGLGFTAWVVYNYNHFLARSFPECAKVDALGNAYLNQLCPANADVGSYQVALTEDVVHNYRPDAIFVESPGYLPYNYGLSNPKVLCDIAPRDAILLGLCFCHACIQSAGAAGVDAERLRDQVAEHLSRSLPQLVAPDAPAADAGWQRESFNGALAPFLQMREDVAATRYEQIAERCRAAGVKVFGFVPLTGGEDGNLARITSLLDLGLAPVPAANAGAEPVTRRKQLLREGADLIAHGHPASHPSSEDFVSRILACRDAGADGFGCYNYGLVRPAHLEWVRRAVEAWGGA